MEKIRIAIARQKRMEKTGRSFGVKEGRGPQSRPSHPQVHRDVRLVGDVFNGDMLLATVDQAFKNGSATGTAQTRYVHPDHLGSTNVLTNASGIVVQTLSITTPMERYGLARVPPPPILQENTSDSSQTPAGSAI